MLILYYIKGMNILYFQMIIIASNHHCIIRDFQHIACEGGYRGRISDNDTDEIVHLPKNTICITPKDVRSAKLRMG
jgi:hypothetical protein